MNFIFNDAPKELQFQGENGEIIVFVYQEPNAQDHIERGAKIAAFYRGKSIDEVDVKAVMAVQFEYGLKFLKSFRVFGMPINISCDPADSNYREDWKKLIGDRAPDLIISLCQHIFESGGFVPEKNS